MSGSTTGCSVVHSILAVVLWSLENERESVDTQAVSKYVNICGTLWHWYEGNQKSALFIKKCTFFEKSALFQKVHFCGKGRFSRLPQSKLLGNHQIFKQACTKSRLEKEKQYFIRYFKPSHFKWKPTKRDYEKVHFLTKSALFMKKCTFTVVMLDLIAGIEKTPSELSEN